MNKSASQKYIIWKKVGQTPLETIEEHRSIIELNSNVPLTYAGRLDPAAEGQLLVLAGDACKNKDQYIQLDKTYEFSILVGFETDTFDLLGLPSNFSSAIAKNINLKVISEVVGNLIGNHNWLYPAYSSKPVDGKPLWQHAREGGYENLVKQNLVPKTNSIIKEIEVLNNEQISGKDLYRYIGILVDRVSGDFRQQEILKSWEEVINIKNDYQTINITARVGSGTYVRSIVNHISNLLKIPLTTFSITRTSIHDL